MYYYYDILLNFGSDNELFSFYEWEKDDAVEFVKKVPLFRVSTETFLDNLKYQVQYEKEVISLIQNKTIVKANANVSENLMIISDNKNALALEIGLDGTVIGRSKLLLEDEENLLEILYTMKETHFDYKKIKKYKNRNSLRQIEKIKKLIKCELDTLYESKNVSKLKFLYYEWFNKSGKNIDLMYHEMQEKLSKEYNANLKKIYDFIKISYNKN